MSILPNKAPLPVDSEVLNLYQKQFRIEQSGRSMIEMLGVLAIIGVLSVGGIAGYSKAMMQYKINKTADQITQIAGNVHTLFAHQKNYSALGSGATNMNLVKKAKLFPDETLTDTCNHNSGSPINGASNPFDGCIELYAWYLNGPDSELGKTFVISMHEIPEEVCISLLSYDWASATGGQLVAIGTDVDVEAATANCTGGRQSSGSYIACAGASQWGIPLSVDKAVTACADDCGTSGQCGLSFMFK